MLSPLIRHEVTYNYDELIHYDEAKDKAYVPVTIRWKAHQALIAESKHDFEMRGELIMISASVPALPCSLYAQLCKCSD